MKTLAIASQKGGVGKSTLAVSLAVAAQEDGERVVLLDLDGQGSVAEWAVDRESETPAVDVVTPAQLPQLKTVLRGLEAKGFTLAVLDCPGKLDTATSLAVSAATLCVVPTRPTRVDLRAIPATVKVLNGLRVPFVFVLTQCSPQARGMRAIEAAAGLKLMGLLGEPPVTQRVDYQDAMASGVGVTELEPEGKAASEIRRLWRWIKSQGSMKNGKA